jgi:hypothetical protein
LKNVFIKNATHGVLCPDGAQAAANPQGWAQIKEFAHGISTMPYQGTIYTMGVFTDGQMHPGDLVEVETDRESPADLLSKHRYHLPLWQDVFSFNVKEKYNAKGDGIADDTEALQKAIDEGEYVFLPKGYYRITRTLRLKPHTKLVGVAQHLSQILVGDQAEGEFADGSLRIPAIQTADTAEADTVLAYAGVITSRELTWVYALEWRCGGNSQLRNFVFYADPGYYFRYMSKDRDYPWVVVRGNGGGKWYNFWCDQVQGGDKFRILLIENTRQPFYIYACNPEHTRSEVNMEICGARNVSIFGLKAEYNAPTLLIRDSDHIAVYSHSGNASAFPGTALLRVENTPNFLLALIGDLRGQTGGGQQYYFGDFFDPALWHMIHETAPGGDIITTAPMERPAVYKRGM